MSDQKPCNRKESKDEVPTWPEEFSGRENRLIEYFGRTMHALTCGDWNAAGFETKQSFRVAAGFAVVALNQEGLDLLDILPKEARGHRD